MVAPPTVHDKGVSAQRELVLHVMSGSVSSARHSWDRALSDIQTLVALVATLESMPFHVNDYGCGV